MPRSCTVCEHPEREEIDRALVGGASNRSAASLYDVSEAAVRRHRTNHLPAKMVMAENAAEVADADNLLDQVGDLQRRTMAVLAAAEVSREHRTALAAIREARGNLELIGEVTKELNRVPTLNLSLHPQYIEARTLIVEALDPYPQAKEAVVRALESGGNGRG